MSSLPESLSDFFTENRIQRGRLTGGERKYLLYDMKEALKGGWRRQKCKNSEIKKLPASFSLI